MLAVSMSLLPNVPASTSVANMSPSIPSASTVSSGTIFKKSTNENKDSKITNTGYIPVANFPKVLLTRFKQLETCGLDEGMLREIYDLAKAKLDEGGNDSKESVPEQRSFYNIKRKEREECKKDGVIVQRAKPLLKTQVFVSKDHSTARAYIKLFKKSDENIKNGNWKAGSYKAFSKAFCLTVDKVNGVTGKWVARVTCNFQGNRKQDRLYILKSTEKECRLLQSLESDNITQLLDCAEYHGKNKFYKRIMYQELYACDLQKFFEVTPSISIPQKAKIFLDTLRGLAALHEKDIVHCDLRMENIFLRENGEALIGDLDCANQYYAVAFSPPEEWSKYLQDKIHEKSQTIDVWMLGHIFCELLNGIPPRWLQLKTLVNECDGCIDDGFDLIDEKEMSSDQKAEAPGPLEDHLISAVRAFNPIHFASLKAKEGYDELINNVLSDINDHFKELSDYSESQPSIAVIGKAVIERIKELRIVLVEKIEKIMELWAEYMDIMDIIGGRAQGSRLISSTPSSTPEPFPFIGKSEKYMLKGIVQKMLHPDSSKRPTAAQLLKDHEEQLELLTKDDK